MLLMKKRIRGRICHATHRYAAENNKYIARYIAKTKNHHILCIWM